MKYGESGTDSGWVHLKIVGLGHILMGNPMAEIDSI